MSDTLAVRLAVLSRACLMLVLFLGSSPLATPAQAQVGDRLGGVWEMLSGPVDPTQTANAHAIHDPRRHRMVLVNGNDFGTLWKLSLPATGALSWQRVRASGPEIPSVRGGFTAVYDSLRDRVLVFGGAYAFVPTSEVWALSLGDAPVWTRITTQGVAPPGRMGHVAVFDPRGDRMVIFGGAVMPDYAGQQYFDDTWQLEFAETPIWTQVAQLGSVPTARKAAAAVYDPWNIRMVVFGGWNGLLPLGVPPIFDDTWALSLDGEPHWTHIDIPAPLYSRQEHVAVLDPVGRQMLVSGGNMFQWSHFTADTWALPMVPANAPAPPAWSQVATTGSNPAVGGHAALYSPERRSLIQFGGQAAGNECFELDLATGQWSAVDANAPATFPSRRDVPSLIPDHGGSRLLAFGGGRYGCPSDLWSFDLAGQRTWHQLPTSGIPQMCGDHNFIHDVRRHRLLSIGNTWTGTFQASEIEVWAMPLDEPHAWTRVDVVGPLPPRRDEFSLAYDSRRDRVLLFGGVYYPRRSADRPDDKDDLWSFSLADQRFTQLNPVNSPGTRRRHWAGYDAIHDRMLVVGGAHSGYRNWSSVFDCWALPLGGDSLVWSPLGPDAPQLQLGYEAPEMAAAIDPVRDRLLVWNGYATVSALDLSSPAVWTPLITAGETPTPRSLFGIAYDEAGDQVLFMGGSDGSMKGDLQALHLSKVVRAEWLRSNNGLRRDRAQERIELAILADDGFSPDSVRIETATLDGVGLLARRALLGDVHGEREVPALARRDVNGDGRIDLVLRFSGGAIRGSVRDHTRVLRAQTSTFEILAQVTTASTSRTPPGGGPAALDREFDLAPETPAASVLAVRYRLPSSDPARLEVFDLAGRRVLDRSLKPDPGVEQHLVLGGHSLQPGVYLIRLKQESQEVVVRAVLLH